MQLFPDHVFAYSFETFTRFDSGGKEIVNEQFAATFYSTLASYYGLDPRQFSDERTLKDAIITQRKNIRSLLVLDNIETLIEAQRRDNEAANQLASFVTRFIEDKNTVLLTSRDTPPADWGHATIIELSGLDDFNGAKLFLTSLANDRRDAAEVVDCIALTQYVKGHPLSIRLLAGRFSDDSVKNLHDFLTNVQNELASARQKTPRGDDPNRHATLSECLEYSIRRLSDEQKKVLYTVGIFLAPFLEGWGETLLNDIEKTKEYLQDLVRLGLLERNKDFPLDGGLLEMHPMLRSHIKREIEKLGASIRERHGLIYENLMRQAWKTEDNIGYDQSAFTRYLVLQSLSDCEAALREEALLPTYKSLLAYNLAQLYVRQGRIVDALKLYNQSLAIDKGSDDVRGVAVTQSAMADVLVQQGQVEEAMKLYNESLATQRKLGDVRGVAVTLTNYSQFLWLQKEYIRSLTLIWEAYMSLPSKHFPKDSHSIYSIIISMKENFPDNEPQFDALWLQATSTPQPDWLRNIQVGSSSKSSGELDEATQTILEAIAAFVNAPDWDATQHVLKERQDILFSDDTEKDFEQLIEGIKNDERLVRRLKMHLAILHDCKANGIAETFAKIKAGQQAQQSGQEEQVKEIMDAIMAFVTADNWDDTQNVLKVKQAILFQPEAEAVFEQIIERYKNDGQQQAVKMLTMHLEILRACKADGIEKTFERVKAMQASGDEEDDGDESAEQQAAVEAFLASLPFDIELIPRSIEALSSGPQVRMAHMQYLTSLVANTENEQLKALVNTIQLAMFGGNMAQLGKDLTGLYRESWDIIMANAGT